MNRAVFSKFGLKLGTVIITFKKSNGRLNKPITSFKNRTVLVVGASVELDLKLLRN